MKNRFYLLLFALLALVFMSQSRAEMAGSMLAPAEGDEEVTDSIVPVAIVNGDSLFASLTQAFYSATDTAETNIQLLADVPMGVVRAYGWTEGDRDIQRRDGEVRPRMASRRRRLRLYRSLRSAVSGNCPCWFRTELTKRLGICYHSPHMHSNS